LDDPGSLAVRWHFTELDVVDRAEHIARTGLLQSLIRRGRPRFTGRTDRIGDMATAFRRLARRRLVIVGEPGMGKTTLAVLLVRELLDHAEPHDPVPVLLSMSSWRPDAESLYEWLARRLAEDYPALRATAFGPDAAHSLATQRRILPILDGLDELPAPTRPKIIIRLNEVAADPLVLTCRTTEYEAAVAAPRGDVLTAGAVIEPNPLTPADAAAYVTGCVPPRTRNGWPDLLAAVNSDPKAPIAHALSTPLALWLLRKVYVETHRPIPEGTVAGVRRRAGRTLARRVRPRRRRPAVHLRRVLPRPPARRGRTLPAAGSRPGYRHRRLGRDGAGR
jgi:DNA polymerase III delta prime subunit